jgi:hypothetical protein
MYTHRMRPRVATILGRRSSFRLAVRSAKLLQVAPLKEIRKTMGLGLDPQTVDRGPSGSIAIASFTTGTPPNNTQALLHLPTY